MIENAKWTPLLLIAILVLQHSINDGVFQARASQADDCSSFDAGDAFRAGDQCHDASEPYSLNTPDLGGLITDSFATVGEDGAEGAVTYQWDLGIDASTVEEFTIEVRAGTDQDISDLDFDYWGLDEEQDASLGQRILSDWVTDGVSPGADTFDWTFDDPDFIETVLSGGGVNIQFYTDQMWWIDWVEVTVVYSAPEISVSPSELDFGSVEVGDFSTSEETIANVGDDGPLTGSPELVGSDADQFSFEPEMSFALDPGESLTYEVTYTPEDEGSHSAVFEIPHNGGNEQSLFGILFAGHSGPGGEPEISVSPSAIIFGDVYVGTSVTSEVTIENVGDGGPLTGSPAIVGEYGDEFSFDPQATYSLNPGQSTAYEVTYAPSSEVPHSATFEIPHNDTSESAPIEINLTGEGVPLEVDLDEAFITTWETLSPGDSIFIPTSPGTMYNFIIDWGDGTVEYISDTDPNPKHVYSAPGTYAVAISGTFPHLFLDADSWSHGSGDRENSKAITSLEHWGGIKWVSMKSAFAGAENMTYNASDVPDLSSVTDMSRMFQNASSFNGDISEWDVSGIEKMTTMFGAASLFDNDIGNWDVSEVQTMSGMFAGASSFNHDLSQWDVSNVTNMSGMFTRASSFDQNIGEWSTVSVTNLSRIFNEAESFNQDISEWDVSNVTDMSRLFLQASSFDSYVNSWDVSSVTDLSFAFAGASSFNQNISDWDVSNVNNMWGMFSSAEMFNKDIGIWDVSNVTDMRGMFYDASSFNHDLTNWDVSSVTKMTQIFEKASSFNGEIGSWDVSNVASLFSVFENASSFNQDISSWDVSYVINMNSTFRRAESFDQDISGWNVSRVTNMGAMFYRASSFDQDISSWNVENVETFQRLMWWRQRGFLEGAGLSADNYDTLLNGWVKLDLVPDLDFNAGNSQFSEAAAEARQNIIDDFGWSISDGGMIGPEISASPDGFAFDEVPIGASVTTEITIENVGGDGLLSGSPELVGADSDQFTFDPPMSYSLDPGESTTYEVIYAPEEEASHAAVFEIPHNGANESSPIGVALSGEALEDGGSNPDFFLAENGVTVKCPDANIGDTGEVGSTVYTKRTRDQITTGNAAKTCTSGITDMSRLFQDESSFDEDISTWDVSSVTDMSRMFFEAESFNQNLGSWDVSAVEAFSFESSSGTTEGFMEGAELSPPNYDALLMGWSELGLVPNLNFDAGASQYTEDAAEARQSIIDDFGWSIADGGLTEDGELPPGWEPVVLETYDDLFGHDYRIQWYADEEETEYVLIFRNGELVRNSDEASSVLSWHYAAHNGFISRNNDDRIEKWTTRRERLEREQEEAGKRQAEYVSALTKGRGDVVRERGFWGSIAGGAATGAGAGAAVGFASGGLAMPVTTIGGAVGGAMLSGGLYTFRWLVDEAIEEVSRKRLDEEFSNEYYEFFVAGEWLRGKGWELSTITKEEIEELAKFEEDFAELTEIAADIVEAGGLVVKGGFALAEGPLVVGIEALGEVANHKVQLANEFFNSVSADQDGALYKYWAEVSQRRHAARSALLSEYVVRQFERIDNLSDLEEQPVLDGILHDIVFAKQIYERLSWNRHWSLALRTRQMVEVHADYSRLLYDSPIEEEADLAQEIFQESHQAYEDEFKPRVDNLIAEVQSDSERFDNAREVLGLNGEDNLPLVYDQEESTIYPVPIGFDSEGKFAIKNETDQTVQNVSLEVVDSDGLNIGINHRGRGYTRER